MGGVRHVRRGSSWRRRILLLVAAMAVLPLLGTSVLLLSTVREPLVRSLLPGLLAGLPGGGPRWEAIAWPRLGHLELRGLSWVLSGDTLLAAALLRVDLELASLGRGDLRLHELTVEGLRLDLPALHRAFPSREAAGGGRRFPRTGSLPPLSSLACDRLAIGGDQLRLDSLHVIRGLELAGSVELGATREPALRLDRLRLALVDPAATLEGDSLSWLPAQGQLEGRLAARMAGRWMHILARSPGADLLRVTAALGDSLHTLADLGLTAAVQRHGHAWRGAEFSGQLQVAAVRQLAVHLPAAPSAPDLPALKGLLRGSVAWEPALALDLGWRGAHDAWLEEILLQLGRHGEDLLLDSLVVRGSGMELAGHARLGQDEVEAAIALHLRQAAPLRTLFGLEALPADLQVDANLQATGARRHPELRARLQASSRGLRLRTALANGGDSQWQIGELVIEDVQSATPPAGRGGGRLTRTATGGWTTSSLRLAGVLGELEAAGSLGEQGSIRFAWSLPALAPPLSRLLGLSDSLGHVIDLALRSGDPLHLTGQGRFLRSKGGLSLEGAGTLAAPGPERLGALLPATARLDGLGDLEADWRAGLDQPARAPLRWSAALEARGSGWLDSLATELSGSGGTIVADTLWFWLPQMALWSRGALLGRELELDARWDLQGLALASRLLPNLAGTEAGLEGSLAARGPTDQLRLDLQAAGYLHRAGLMLPDLRLALRRDSLGLRAICWAPGGMEAGALHVDTLAARYAGPAGPDALPWPGRLWLRESGARHSIEADLLIRQEEGWRMTGGLTLAVGDGTLSTERPFTLALPATGGVGLEDLAMAGSMGHLAAQALLGPDSLLNRVELVADLDLRRLPWPDLHPAVPRPGPLHLDLTASSIGLSGRLELNSLQAGSAGRLDLALVVAGPLDGPALTLSIMQDGDSLLAALGRLPARLTLWPLAARPGFEELDLAVQLRHFPLLLPTASMDPSDAPVLVVDGQARLAGSARHPRLEGELAAAVHGEPRLTDYRATASLRMDGRETDTVLHSTLGVLRGERQVLAGTLDLPLPLAAVDDSWERRPGDLEVRLTASALALEDINPLLPYDLWMSGRGDLELHAFGPFADPRLDGQLRMENLDLRRTDGTHLFGRARLALGGRVRHPEGKGWLELANGEARIPELPRDLHDMSGEAILWGLSMGGEQGSDKVAGGTTVWQDSLELELELRIPNRVRLRGGELDLESRGRLTLRMTEGRTALVGDMEVLSGQFSLLGRQFAVQSGTLSWFGDEVLTPRLDLELSASVGNTLITVRLTGTMEQPLLELSSEPPLDEGEIMALLLFRRSTEELDNQQQDMLQRQATQLAADYGMAALQARLSRTLHIDLLRVETGGEEGLGTLMVGKYLGPRVLLRYEQSLSQQDLFRLNVDYILSRHLRLDTSTGSRGQSGMALNWSRMW